MAALDALQPLAQLVVDEGRELFDHQRDCAVHDVGADSREAFRRGRRSCFHGFTECASRVLRCSDCQLLLETTKPAHFVHEGQVSAHVAHKQLGGLATHARCVFAGE